MSIRIGHGFDVHAFEPGDAVLLGGVKIPHHQQFVAHSDGDVLIHAFCDAILGALALGDIGQHFPDNDDAHKNRDSREFLRHVYHMARLKGFELGNADITIIAQAPKMMPHLEAMKEHLAEDLKVERSQINIKATTTEKLGYTGREEGIAVHAVVLMQST